MSCTHRKDMLVQDVVPFTVPLEEYYTEWVSTEGIYTIHFTPPGNVTATIQQSFGVEPGDEESVVGMDINPLVPYGSRYYVPTAPYFRIKMVSASNWLPHWPARKLMVRDVTPLFGK